MKKRSNLAVCSSLIGLVKPLTWFMVLAVIMGLVGHLCAAFITIFGAYAILDLLGIGTIVTVKVAFISMGVFAILRAFLRYGEQTFNHYIAFKLLALIRDKVFKALRRLSPAKLEGRDKGNLISIITSDIELLEVFYAHTISPILIAIGMTVFMSLFIGQYHWVLGLTALIAYVVVGVIIPITVSKKNRNNGIKFRTKAGELSSFVLDSLRGISETIQFNMGKERMDEMERRTDDLLEDEEGMKNISGQNMAVTNTVILSFDFLMIAFSSVLYYHGIIGFDGVIISVVALMSSFGPVIALANLGSTLQNTFAAGDRVLDILEEKPVIEEVENQPKVIFSGANCENVTFAYGEETILSDMSIEIPKNMIIGIEGKSGSGKSTLLKLLMRFWDVKQGNIKISGVGIDNINTNNLRDMESYMTQETHLFHDSIKNNIRIAKLDATDKEIEQACKKASIHDFIIKLPKGYDTPVGELGDSLSGGERQRIGLARAFLHNAPFMLLDEPTSNVDSLNEAIILKSLYEQGNDITVVISSHRKSTMKIADEVYSVEYGRSS